MQNNWPEVNRYAKSSIDDSQDFVLREKRWGKKSYAVDISDIPP
jgi:hypothetical protein